MDVLSLQFKRGLGQRRGVYLISTSHYAAAFGYYKIGLAESTFNDRFAKFKYAGYGAVDRILCFGLICISPIPEAYARAKNSYSEASSVAKVCHTIEQDILHRLDAFRLKYTDTGRRSEWICADLGLTLGVFGDYHDRLLGSGHTRYMTKGFGIDIEPTDAKYPRQKRGATIKTQNSSK